MENGQVLDRRVKRSQEALKQALLDLLQEKPLQDISVNAISERADVNRSTFYAHYTDKYELFHACVRLVFEEALRSRLPEPEDIQCETLKELIIVTCEFFGQMSHGCSPQDKQLDPMIETEVQDVLHTYLLAWLESGDSAQSLSPEHIHMRALIMSWAIFGAGIEYRNNPDGRTPEEIASVAYELMAARVLPETYPA